MNERGGGETHQLINSQKQPMERKVRNGVGIKVSGEVPTANPHYFGFMTSTVKKKKRKEEKKHTANPN